MPHLFPNLSDLTEADLNAQRAAFVAVLAGMGREWGGHTKGIVGFALTLQSDDKNEFDADIRSEMCGIVTAHAQQLRRLNHAVQFAAQILSGIPIPCYEALLDLRELMGNISASEFPGWIGKPAPVSWSEPDVRVKTDERQWFAMLSALVRHGLYFGKIRLQNTLRISVTRENDAVLLFTFTR